MSDRGHAPDHRDIDDLAAVEECPRCGLSPAPILLVDGDWECYNCGADSHAEGDNAQ